jgi:hypothetical protein
MKKYIEDIIKEMEYQDEIKTLTPNEIFQIVLSYEGFVGYSGKIKQWIKDIYGIEIE